MNKVDKLVAAYEAFGKSIATVPDERAKALFLSSCHLRDFLKDTFKRVPKPTPSQVATGLEQGWRETPLLIQDIGIEWRAQVAQAWHLATLENFPEFLKKGQEMLEKVRLRGEIRGQAEFYRIRHEIDLLELEPGRSEELESLYKLVDAYESR